MHKRGWLLVGVMLTRYYWGQRHTASQGKGAHARHCHAIFFPLNPISPEPKATKHNDRETVQVGPATPHHHTTLFTTLLPQKKWKQSLKFLRKCPFCGVSFQWVHRPVSAGAFGATVTYLEWQWILIFITVISTFFGWNNFKMNILPGKVLN